MTTLDRSTVGASLGSEAPLIDYQYGKVELAGRQAATSPFSGGAALAKSASNHGLECTAGMSVVKNGGSGAKAMLTAGHCYGNNEDVYTPAGVHVGTIGLRSCGNNTGNDMNLIEGGSYQPYIFLGGVNSGTISRVTGAGTGAMGVIIYSYSGARTGENGLYEIVDDDFNVYIGATGICDPWILHAYMFQRHAGGAAICDVDGGDSGAPFYYKDPGNNIGIRGMVFAYSSDRTECFAESWNRIHNQLNVVIDQ